ncbi:MULTISPECIES: Dam family site-specific DNA-(adenine-N6)-methyltransferase [Cronobacter]|uniref:Dam family site-specific DNA-(adenine-N6)-methyltransferase n=1 Tax=Cronobacter TaxID=413496 RepID=UPI000577F1C3|nr:MULTISPECIES: Dam family site-specific DNA-(adenine-N6)-methyltransferase [Cronobacter]ELY2751855.1 Dam family site-specific DNA-(adenine-N6)-methyltransferase [Cronobacter sakazakii]ELY2905426.1 Dam family site-specific DNA-(adenine-N6)-methyltransferase [Cronobacter sakazakii]ELY4435301.1 Dam family site-specific DNA-(adenine-N6)-methyltransferase [Cronobacter sakazakii]MDK1195690.1 Dam family site-specific DNA-(adenine-N6)-methyltransferase [Cronobacter dublinensis]NCH42623.1 Dam family 
MAVKTPLKWVGSKARLMPLLLPHLPKGQRLVEPFAGSCAVMMNTDYDEYLVADVNPDLIGFYRAAAAETSDLIERARHLFETFNSEHGYYDSRDSFNHDGDPAWRPALFLYLNRHGFNGLCRYNKAGRFNVPYGKYKKPYFPENEIKAFAEKAKRATFVCSSYTETLGMVRAGDVVYCDPPYLTETANFTAYHENGFSQLDHGRLARRLRALAANGVPVVASNSDEDMVRYLFAGFESVSVIAPRSVGAAAGSQKKAAELILKGPFSAAVEASA